MTEKRKGIFAMSAKGGGKSCDNDKVNFALPLPEWLDNYESGHIIVKGFLNFIKQWYPVLTSQPDAVPQCLPDTDGGGGFPSRKKRSNNTIHNLAIPFVEQPISIHQRLRIDKVDQRTVALAKVSLVDGTEIGLEYAEFTSTGKSKIKSPKATTRISLSTAGVNIGEAQSQLMHVLGSKEEAIVWLLRRSNLDLVELQQTSTASFYQSSVSKIESGVDKWILQSVSSGNSNALPVAFHCSTEDARRSDDDSIDGNESDGDSGFESESETESDDSTDTDTCRHYLIVAARGGRPFWFPWTVDSKQLLKISCCFHPQESISMWTHTPYEICTLNMRSGTITKDYLPEPDSAQFGGARAICKELRLSACGKLLYYFLCLFSSDNMGSICHIYLTTWRFDPSASSISERFQNERPVQSISYRFADSAKTLCSPLVLTEWSDTYLLAALPPLYSAPRVIRISLRGDLDGSSDTGSKFETLRSQIFVPSSTPSRNPQIMMLGSKLDQSGPPNSSPEHLILSLDPEDESRASPNSLTSPARILTWFLPDRGGWRHWDPVIDECSEQLKDSHAIFQMLRGSYVDPSRRFNVPIRSELNWTKKAFVSCA